MFIKARAPPEGRAQSCIGSLFGLSCKLLVSVEADLCEFLSLLEELGGSVWEELVEGCKSYLTLEEVLELGPVRLLAVEGEWVLALLLE